MAFFEVTYANGDVEEIEADECLELGRHLTFVNYRIPFVWTVYTEIVRRLDRRAKPTAWWPMSAEGWLSTSM